MPNNKAFTATQSLSQMRRCLRWGHLVRPAWSTCACASLSRPLLIELGALPATQGCAGLGADSTYKEESVGLSGRCWCINGPRGCPGLPRAAQGGCERCATTPQRRSPSFTRRPADAQCLPCEDRDLTAPSHTVTTPWGRPGIAPAALPMGTAPYARDDPTAPVPAASRWGRLAHCRRLLIALT